MYVHVYLWCWLSINFVFARRNKPDELTRIGSFIKRGSGFRYSGVTLRQIRSKQHDRPKSQPMMSTQIHVEVGKMAPLCRYSTVGIGVTDE